MLISLPLKKVQLPTLLGLCKTLHIASFQLQINQAQDVAIAAEKFAENTSKFKITINGRDIIVPEGSSILQACMAAGIYVPTLCNHPRLVSLGGKILGTCRLCLVEDTSDHRLKPACATPVTNNMKIETDTPEVKNTVKGILGLLKANHPLDCMTCDASGNCEFQDLLKRYNIRDGIATLRHDFHEWDDERHDFESEQDHMHDASSPAITIDLDKCLKCGRCVTACGIIQGMNVLGFVNRGDHRHPAIIADELASSPCIECGQCASVCPVNAIASRSEWRDVLDALETKRKVMVAMTAPAVRVAIGEEVGMAPGSITQGQMVTALRECGFDKVLDVDFAADLTIMEEGTELLQRLHNAWGINQNQHPGGDDHADSQNTVLPMFTSCCPAWITFVEKSRPDLIPNLSTCKSPQQMMGAVVKRFYAETLGVTSEDICLVSVMPCTAKKHEAEREELKRKDEPVDVDFVLTTREFGQLLRYKHIPLASLPEGHFDSPLGASTGAAVMFGASGGVMEAALRTAYEVATGQSLPKLEVEEIRGLQGVKMATVALPDNAPAGVAGKKIRVAVASGIGNARHLLESIDAGDVQVDFVEVMGCPGGCLGGGGQPKTKDVEALLKRMGAIYTLDEKAVLRKSHENPEVQKLYESYLDNPNSPLAHELLHTTYTDRTGSVVPPPPHSLQYSHSIQNNNNNKKKKNVE